MGTSIDMKYTKMFIKELNLTEKEMMGGRSGFKIEFKPMRNGSIKTTFSATPNLMSDSLGTEYICVGKLSDERPKRLITLLKRFNASCIRYAPDH